MEKPSLILGKLDICDSNGQRWSESYYLKTAEIIQARNDFRVLCRYRASCLASEFTLVSGHLEFSNDHRPFVPVVDSPLVSPWRKKVPRLLTTLYVAIECRFQTEQSRKTSCFFHGLGRAGTRTSFLDAIREIYPTDGIPSPDAVSCPEDGFRAFLAFLRDKTICARTNKANKVLDTAPWKSVAVKDINLDVDPEWSITEKKETDMLPTLMSLNRCKTLKVVQVGPLRLFFELPSNHKNTASRIVGFVVDGQAPCVCDRAGQRVRTDKYLSFIEPDRNKWLPEHEFARKWLETSKMFLGMAGSPA